MEEQTITQHSLGSTAKWTAAVRALESQRTDRLFNDPWAETLAGLEGKEWLAQRPADSSLPIVLRTRYFDDFLLRITYQEGIRQIVLVAAGLDTRAFRLNWPEGCKIYEIDLPEVLANKEQVLHSAGATANCDRRTSAADLTDTWETALTEQNFDPHERSCWLLEGLLFYLANDAIQSLLDRVTSLASPGSWLGFDCINSEVLTSPWTKAWVDMQAQSGAAWIGALDDPKGYLGKLGWSVSLTQAGQSDANYGRWKLPVLPVEAPNMPHNWYVTTHKKPDEKMVLT